MPQHTQYFTTSAGSHLNNRCIFTGSQTTTWPVPEGTTEVHVHVWGGGGGACHTPSAYGRGGGGGGYARASLAVTDSDSLSITVGGSAGTSSVTVPTQSPGSPISATGGGNATSSDRGAGGAGTVALAPTQCQWYCYNANGGAGGKSGVCQSPAGGGAAGSPRGTGGNGGFECFGGGGGIGGSPGRNFKCFMVACTPQPTNAQQNKVTVTHYVGGSALQARIFTACTNCVLTGCIDRTYSGGTTPTAAIEFGSVGCSSFTNAAFNKGGSAPNQAVFTKYYGNTSLNKGMGNEWFYVEDMAGSSKGGWNAPMISHCAMPGDAGAGAGGYGCNHGGVLGGGGNACGSGGCAGGQGSGPQAGFHPGTPGMVVIYW